MKNRSSWIPTKFKYTNNNLSASKDNKFLSVGSRLITNLIALKYQKYIKEFTSGNILDLGCGYVPMLEVYEKYCENIFCIDWENTLHKNPYLDLVADLNHKIPLDNITFQTIICSDVLEHIREPQSFLHEVHRLLEKNGYVLLNTPFLYKIHEKPYDFYRYTEYALLHLANTANFKLVLLEPIGGLPEVLTDLNAKLFQKIPFIGFYIASFIQELHFFLYKNLSIFRSISKKTESTFPLGYFIVLTK